MPRDIRAVVPVKELASAKTRLAGDRSAGFRRGLAQAMLEDVLAALAAARGLGGIIVVTLDADAAALAARHGAQVWTGGARDGHTGAVTNAASRLVAEGCAGMLTVPGDTPGITAEEIGRLLAAHGEAPAFSIVPAHDRRGSNAILMTPPDAVPLAFGDDSFLPHLAAARARGIEPTIVPLPGIGLDIDTAADLALLIARGPSGHTGAFLAAHPDELDSGLRNGSVHE